MPEAISKAEFLQRATKGDVEGVKAALLAGMAANTQDEQRETALHKAALASHAPIVKLLLDHGAQLGIPGQHCRSVLAQVLQRGNVRLIALLFQQASKELVEATATFNKWDRAADAASGASGSKMLDAVEEELRATAALIEGSLREAAAEGKMGLVQQLLEYGFGARIVPEAGQKALHYAIETGNAVLVRSLLELGVDVRANGWSLLAQAVRKGDSIIVARLLEHGATIPATAEARQGALLKAAEEGSLATVHLLLERGTDVHAADETGQTALHKAAHGMAASSATAEDYPGVVKLLLVSGADVRATDQDGKTAVDLAKARGRTAIAELLQAHEAPQDMTHEEGRTPSSYETFRTSVSLLELFLKALKRFRPLR
jgi:ankyrin repeat protein